MNTSLTPSLPHHTIILSAPNLQPSTKRQYIREINLLIANKIDPRNRTQLAQYASGLSKSSRSFLKASLRLLYGDVVLSLKASATAENLASVQAALLNIDAMQKSIHIEKSEGEKVHIWLSQSQVDQLTALPFHKHTDAIRAMRDYIVLALLLGAGLRREELSELTSDALKRLPNGTGYRDVLEIHGKGAKDRVVPISPLLSERLREWQHMTGSGRIVRSINKAGKLGKSLSVIGIFNLVREYGALIGIPNLDPHDCRRSFGRLGYEATHDIVLIQQLLGHADVKTTQIYIGLNIKLDITASDFIIRPAEFFAKVSGD
jgi:site-specific recombinase XerC